MKVNGKKIPSPVIRLVKYLLFAGKGYSDVVEIVKKRLNFDVTEIDVMEIESA